MSEKIKLVITGIKESKYNDKTYYACTTIGGTEYTTTDDQVKQYVGKEHEFDVNSKEDKNGVMRHYLNFPKAGGFGGNKFSGGGKSYGKSREELVLSSKTMVLSYCKDLVVAGINNNKPFAVNTNMWDAVEFGFKKLLPLLDLDSIPKTPESKPGEATGVAANESVYALKPALVAILQEAFKGWHTNSIVKLAGTELGIVLPFDKETGTIHWTKISEADANGLINEMRKT